jgi:hypothetical protein
LTSRSASAGIIIVAGGDEAESVDGEAESVDGEAEAVDGLLLGLMLADAGTEAEGEAETDGLMLADAGTEVEGEAETDGLMLADALGAGLAEGERLGM